MLTSYRARLIFYSVILMLFLSGVVIYSYIYIQQLIIGETDNHIERLAQSTANTISEERLELERYASIVADDLRFQEYLFIVSQVGSSAEPLIDLYDRHYAWLPIDNIYIVDNNKNLLIGKSESEEYINSHFLLDNHPNTPRSYYLQDKNHFEFIATSKINYRNNHLGYIAVTREFGADMLQKLKRIANGQLFLVQNNQILDSTLPGLADKRFHPVNNMLTINNEVYRLTRVDFTDKLSALPQIYLGLPETELAKRLDKHRNYIFSILSIGLLVILITGMLLIRNFHRPLTELMRLTAEVAKGKFPEVSKTQAQNEISELTNHFVDMVVALREKQDEIDKVHEALKKSAITDSLTGLHNRRYLQMVFPKLLAQASRERKHLAAIIVDLDHFKKINDNYGHLAGDICLASFSDELRETSRANDYLFRLGGEEFLILSIIEDLSGIKAYAEKLRMAIGESPVVYQNQEITITISAGISVATQRGTEQETLTYLLAQADDALYAAKEAGRNCVRMSKIVPHETTLNRLSGQ